MGTVLSRAEEPSREALPPAGPVSSDEWVDEETEARKREHEEDMRKFKAEMAAKREARREAIAGLNRKISELRGEVEKERLEKQKLECLLQEGKGRKEEVEGLERQVRALKDVAAIGGEMLRIRELQVNELKEKIKAIEETGVEYDKEVENMRKLKTLYEERSRAMMISHQMEVEREKARVVAAETRLEIAEEKNRQLAETNKELQERVNTLDATVDANNNEISELRIQLAGKKDELYNVTQQMTIVNNLFTQVLSDPENLDRVTRVLEEHHNLVNHLTEKGNINDVASVLMTVADKDHVLTEDEQDIATNLSKVWKLLVELLGHHNKQTPGETMPDSCYKSVDTPSGPKLVISVSQTFLRLKDLILEKNSLVKEVGRLKDLNCHLEKRLISQESRLAEVAAELHKTWGVVNKLKSQHKALHTHEQVLRYELKHKRLMLNELKQQLEDCREMWQMARTKNNQTEKDWKLLRKEFAERKQQISSAESGYEESPGDSQDEDDSHRMSDDESETQEFPSNSTIDVLRMSRLRHVQLDTPDRSNTPDISEADEENCSNELLEENIQQNAHNEVLSNGTPSVQVFPGVLVSAPEDVCESLNPNVEHTISQAENGIDESQFEPEVITVELEPRIHILPWNEPISEDVSSEDNNSNRTEDNTTYEEQEDKSGEAGTGDSIAEEKETQNEENKVTDNTTLSSSSSTEVSGGAENGNTRTSAEEILARREARLKRLEEQCKSLFSKMSNTNKRSDIISSKLVELHEHYGEGRNEPTASQESPLPERCSAPLAEECNFADHGQSIETAQDQSADNAQYLSPETAEHQAAETEQQQSPDAAQHQSAEIAQHRSKETDHQQSPYEPQQQSAYAAQHMSADAAQHKTAKSAELQSSETDRQQSPDGAQHQSAEIAQHQSAETNHQPSADAAQHMSADAAQHMSADAAQHKTAKIAELQSSETDRQQSPDGAQHQSAEIAQHQSAETNHQPSADATQQESPDGALTESTMIAELQSSETDRQQYAGAAQHQSAEIALHQSAETNHQPSADATQQESPDGALTQSTMIAELQSSETDRQQYAGAAQHQSATGESSLAHHH